MHLMAAIGFLTFSSLKKVKWVFVFTTLMFVILGPDSMTQECYVGKIEIDWGGNEKLQSRHCADTGDLTILRTITKTHYLFCFYSLIPMAYLLILKCVFPEKKFYIHCWGNLTLLVKNPWISILKNMLNPLDISSLIKMLNSWISYFLLEKTLCL